jgi:non-specific serine/threonine protein kinase
VIPPAFDTLSDRYRIKAEVGTGGMATVYLADDVRHRRRVAIKVLKPEISAVIGRERFLREIEIAARLNHPHIVPLFDSGAAGDLLYYVMPYVPGESLRARLQRESQLPVDVALRLTREIAAALGHAHQQDLVHRDIKPENILIVDGMALVADFGIARTMGVRSPDEGTQMATMVGAVIGTPQYMSPEQATGGAVDQRSDIYSLACVLFEMLAGHPPFVAPTADALLRMQVTAEARPVTESRPAVPPALARVVARGLAKRPDDRFASTAQFAEAIAAAMTDVATAAARPAPAGTAHNLPRPRTQFFGREPEIAECVRLLDDTRLLTLTGIGGGGKTRLAIRVAETAIANYPEGVWFVDLAPVSDADRVVETVAGVFGVRESPDKDLRTSLGEHLTGCRLLLLDNCEHLLATVAVTVDDLLETAAGLRVLATSREGLGVDGERLFAVRSLAAPPPDARKTTAVAASHAVQLFMDRAQRIAPDFTLTDANAEAVADICRRLDGIPLALELAAARVKLLSVEQIRSRLDDRFRLLTGGKTALPRQQTLQAAIQWSYDQLAQEEQRLLRVLSVFVGGWTLEIAARVYADGADEFGTLDLLSRLVDKSLVLVNRRPDGDTRYNLLETVRQYAAERLVESGDAGEIRRRHADVFLGIAERAFAERVTGEAKWADLLDTEHDNLRAALRLLRDTDSESYLELAGALAWFWHARSYLLEGREHLTHALAASPAAPPRKTLARALWGAAYLDALRGDTASSTPMMGAALQMWREVGALAEVAEALEGVGWAHFLAGDDEKACASFEESVRLQCEAGDPHLVNRAKVALGQALVALGRVEQARVLAAEIIAFSHQHGNLRAEHSGWHYTADCALMEDDYRDALGLYRTSLTLARETGDRLEIGFEVQGVAMSLSGLGQPELALRLGGAVEAEYERIGSSLRVRFWNALLAKHFDSSREAMGAAEAARAWATGRATPFDEAIEQALRASADATP